MDKSLGRHWLSGPASMAAFGSTMWSFLVRIEKRDTGSQVRLQLAEPEESGALATETGQVSEISILKSEWDGATANHDDGRG